VRTLRAQTPLHLVANEWLARGTFADQSFAVYAVYFDYRRRNNPEFRRELQRESRRAARAEKKRANEATQEYRKKIKEVVAVVNAEGFPSEASKREEMFMQCVSEGEVLSAESKWLRCFISV